MKNNMSETAVKTEIDKSAFDAVRESLAKSARVIGRICPEDARVADAFARALKDPARVRAFLGCANV